MSNVEPASLLAGQYGLIQHNRIIALYRLPRRLLLVKDLQERRRVHAKAYNVRARGRRLLLLTARDWLAADHDDTRCSAVTSLAGGAVGTALAVLPVVNYTAGSARLLIFVFVFAARVWRRRAAVLLCCGRAVGEIGLTASSVPGWGDTRTSRCSLCTCSCGSRILCLEPGELRLFRLDRAVGVGDHLVHLIPSLLDALNL